MAGKVDTCIWSLMVGEVEFNVSKPGKVFSIGLSEVLGSSNVLSFVLQDPDLEFVNDKLILYDTKVSFAMFYHGETYVKEFSGYIAAIDFTFPEDGSPTVTVTCLDGTHLLNKAKKTRTWSNKSRPDVVAEVVKAYGLTVERESGYTFKKQGSISQSDQTDIEFIEGLTDEESVLFYCDLKGKKVSYKKYKVGSTAKMTLGYRQGNYAIRSFSPSITLETNTPSSSSDVDNPSKTPKKSSSTKPKSPDVKKGGDNNKSPDRSGMVYDPSTGKWKKKTTPGGYQKKKQGTI